MSDAHAGHEHAQAPKKGGPLPLLIWAGVAVLTVALLRGCHRNPDNNPRAAATPPGEGVYPTVGNDGRHVRRKAERSSTDEFFVQVLRPDATRRAVNGLAELAIKEHYIAINGQWQVDPDDRSSLKTLLLKLEEGVPVNVELTKTGAGTWKVASAEKRNGEWVEVPDVWESKEATDRTWRRSWIPDDWKSDSGRELPLFPIFQLRLPEGSLKEGMTPYVIISVE